MSDLSHGEKAIQGFFCKHRAHLGSVTATLLLVVGVVTLITASQFIKSGAAVPVNDSIGYLSVAVNLHDTGMFTDGTYERFTTIRGAHGEGMFFGPVYPSFLALLMKLDPDFYQTAVCVVKNPESAGKSCALDQTILMVAQACLAVLSFVLIWLSAWYLTGGRTIAWLALGFALLTNSYCFTQIMTEAITLPLFTLMCLLAVVGYKKKSLLWIGLAGLVLGFLTLNRPSFAYLFYVTMVLAAGGLAGWVLFYKAKPGLRELARLVSVFILGYALVVTPWVIRNGQTFGIYNVSAGYAPFILAQRLILNDMTWQEWTASYIYFLPVIGVPVAEKIFPPSYYERFDNSQISAFSHKYVYAIANAAESVKNTDRQLPYLIHHGVLAHPFKHVWVTISLAWSGLWIVGGWSLLAIPAFLAFLGRTVKKKDVEYMIFSLPGLYLLGFNAAISLNVTRYNLLLLPSVAIALAWAVLWFYDAYIKEKLFK